MTTTTYARVHSGVVAELFSTDRDISLMFSPSLTWVPIGGSGALVGWTYDGTTFAAPVIPSMSGDELAQYAHIKQQSLASGGVIVNAAPPLTTNATTAAGNTALHFAAVPSWVAATQPVANITAPSVISGGTTVSSKTGTTIVMSAPATGAGVGASDVIQLSVPVYCSTDPDSKANLAGLFLLAQINPSMTVEWVTGMDSETLTGPQISQMAILVGLFVQATFTTLATVLDGIAALTITTKAEIDAAAWPATS